MPSTCVFMIFGCYKTDVIRHTIQRIISTRVILSVICTMAVVSAVGQMRNIPDTLHFRLRYVINIPELDSTFVDNGSRMTTMQEFLQEVRDDKLLKITDVRFRGTASPDGPYEFNVWLSKNRLRTFKELVRSYINIPDSIIHANTSDIPWDEFRACVEASDIEYRDESLAIIDEEPRLVPFYNNRHIDARLLKLKKLHKGKAWEILKNPILHDLRYGDAIFAFTRIQPEPLAFAFDSLTFTPPIFQIVPPPVDEPWTRKVYLKTNFIGLAALSANLAVEFDLACHWSFTLPIYYNALDYFKSTIKFRNFTVQPELRYWPSAKTVNDGFFVGAHFGLMYYNFAIDGPYRYQDRRGRTPAMGGGLAVGYRKPISKNKRWHIEYTAGAGVYPIDYDVFENTPNYKEGQWTSRNKKTFIGLDQAAVTLSYNFNLSGQNYIQQKGGTR